MSLKNAAQVPPPSEPICTAMIWALSATPSWPPAYVRPAAAMPATWVPCSHRSSYVQFSAVSGPLVEVTPGLPSPGAPPADSARECGVIVGHSESMITPVTGRLGCRQPARGDSVQGPTTMFVELQPRGSQCHGRDIRSARSALRAGRGHGVRGPRIDRDAAELSAAAERTVAQAIERCRASTTTTARGHFSATRTGGGEVTSRPRRWPCGS